MVARVKATFPDLLQKRLHEITPWAVERWRAHRHRAGILPTTTNRDLDSLRSVLTKAVEWNIISAHPLRSVKRTRVDAIGRLGYLSEEEEARLRKELKRREHRHREGRASFNRWREERGLARLPDYGCYADHLHPIVLLALNTELRRRELFSLRWRDVDLVRSLLTVRGSDAKSGKTQHVPLNEEARTVLRSWRADLSEVGDLVFPGPTGERMQTLKTAWGTLAEAAGLTNFTFHDLRHTFASHLVQRGVDLNTVRELLGHADIRMTLRYSHLAPEHKAAAVALLGKSVRLVAEEPRAAKAGA
jgi:integrase